MATYYVRTDGNDSNTGTTDSSGGAWLTLDYAGVNVAAGDTIYVRASAGNASSYPTSSLDYTISSYFTPTAGSATAGRTKWIGYNGMPTIGVNGAGFILGSYQHWEGLYLVGTGSGTGSYGILGCSNSNVFNCVINLNSQAGLVGINGGGGNVVITNCDIYGGSTSPTYSSGSYGISAFGVYGSFATGTTVRFCRDHGILANHGAICGCVIYGCAGDGIYVGNADTAHSVIANNTIDDNLGHGINLTASNAAAWWTLKNNIVSNHTQSGKVGIRCATTDSDKRKAGWGWNCLYNNTTNYENITADASDITSNPTYADAANGDYTPTNSALKVANPTTQGGPFGTVVNELWIGAVQPAEAAGGIPNTVKVVTNIGTY